MSQISTSTLFLCESVKYPDFKFQAIDVISLERIKSRSALCDLLHVSRETFVHLKFILYLCWRTNECEKRSEDQKKAEKSKWTWIEQEATFPLENFHFSHPSTVCSRCRNSFEATVAQLHSTPHSSSYPVNKNVFNFPLLFFPFFPFSLLTHTPPPLLLLSTSTDGIFFIWDMAEQSRCLEKLARRCLDVRQRRSADGEGKRNFHQWKCFSRSVLCSLFFFPSVSPLLSPT